MNTIQMENMLGGYDVIGHKIATEMDLFEISKEGLPKSALLSFSQSVDMSVKSLTGILNITERTLQRKKDLDLLNENVSEHILQLAEVYSRGKEVLGNLDDFKIWADTPNKALGDKRPFDLLSSRYGVQMVLDELGRIEYGIIS
ncbi:MAG: DUF2384 domain-containing protein [Spirochaetales bacterium]|nr:DUF2384 domain-containing protein [Spirochaetales bacterium]